MNAYFDNASTSFPKPKIVVDSIYNYLINVGGNANRSNHSYSLSSGMELFKAREKIAEFFNYNKASNVIFTSNITMSYIYLIAIVHILHVVVGIICLLVVIYNHFKQKYNSRQYLGIELGAMYWHFLDFLWVYLFLFLYFFK